MKKRLKHILMALALFLSLFLVGCSDQKTPEKGYVTDDDIFTQVVSKIDEMITFEKYSYSGTLNYFEYDELLVPRTINKKNVVFEDSPSKYSDKCKSYYLSLPLHITPTNWKEVKDENGKISENLSTKYRLESRIYQPKGGYLDRVYYYMRDGGGFYLKAFGVNKPLRIENPSGITCHAKWDIIVEYDANGFLVSENFTTLNAHSAPDSESCYGRASYSYSK